METITVNSEQLEAYCNTFFHLWEKNYGEKNYEECRSGSDKFINEIKLIYKNRLHGEGADISVSYSYMYLFLMLAKGFENMIDLVELTKDKSWPEDHERTEAIWQTLWDAKERLDVFTSHYLDQEILVVLYGQLKELEHCFYDLYGKGLYMSSVILVKKAICSICGKNIKGCMHIPGNLYDGKYCKEQVEDFEFHGADFVQSPHDMRCRVWPWNFIDKQHINVRIMNLNQLDGFITE